MARKLSGYCWRNGTHAGPYDVYNDTYAVENFTRQNDMVANVHWLRPGNRSDIITVPEVVLSLGGDQKDNGSARFVWTFPYLSPLMMQYLLDTFFSSTPYSSEAQTVRTWNRATGQWEYYNATALWPTPEILNGLETAGKGWRDVPIRFIKGTKYA